MPRRGLELEEALALFEELPSDDSETSISEDSNDEEYAPEIVQDDDLDDFPPVEDVGNIPVIQSEAGPSQAPEIIWEKRDISREIPEFEERRTGPSDEILGMEDQTPLSIFLLFFSMQMMENIVFQTNLYATQQQKSFNPLLLGEFLKFLAINLLMGIKRSPSYRDYWSSEPDMHDSFISAQMSIKRFSWILSHFHLNDNALQPKRGEPGFDKLYKLRPLISELSDKFLSFLHPHENQAIDESMVKFKGRSTMKQYMPKKPIKRGYKIWMRCDMTGYACQFEIYTGKTSELVEKNLAERVVKDLCIPIFGKNHKLFMDNFFSSYNLFRFLETKKIFCCGTVNLTRKNLPKNLLEDKKMNRGDIDWLVSNENIMCLKWKDKRCVTVLSNQSKPNTIFQVERKQKDGSTVAIACPKAIVDYNRNMGFVDHFDHLKSLYEIDRKSMKWWHRIFFHLLDMTVVNSFLLYKMCHGDSDKMNLKDFRREIISGLIKMYPSDENPKREHARLSVPIRKHKPFVPPEKRLKHAEHSPLPCTLRRCAHCSTEKKQKRTRWMCSTCDVPLCMQRNIENCFTKFHKK